MYFRSTYSPLPTLRLYINSVKTKFIFLDNAINSPIQGSAADIIKIAMVRIHETFTEENLKSRMILQVHDELNFNVWPAELALVRHIVKKEMENASLLKVPLTIDMGEGANWLEAH